MIRITYSVLSVFDVSSLLQAGACDVISDVKGAYQVSWLRVV